MDEPTVPVRIAAALARLEDEYDVEILFASESGSRAWGMASPDSDYDVRGVFRPRRPETATTELLARLFQKKLRDQIDFMSEDRVLDISLWSVHKTLTLVDTGNTMLFEWLRSSIVYRNGLKTPDETWMEFFSRHLSNNNMSAHMHHFFGFLMSHMHQNAARVHDKADVTAVQVFSDSATRAVNAYKKAALASDWAMCDEERTHLDACLTSIWNQAHSMQTPVPLEVKKLCYSVRPALYLEHMHQHGSIPPLDLTEVLRGLVLPPDLRGRIDSLLEKKRTSKEKALCEDADTVVEHWLCEVRERTRREVATTPRTPYPPTLIPHVYAETMTYV